MYNNIVRIDRIEYQGKKYDVFMDQLNNLYFYQVIMTMQGERYFSPLVNLDELTKYYESIRYQNIPNPKR